MRIRPSYFFERQLWGSRMTAVAGVDEIGVGALAGPVVAAAVILAPDTIIDGLADSKLLTPKRREALFAMISERAVTIAIGQAEVEEVDRVNAYWAAMEARRRAVGKIGTKLSALVPLVSLLFSSVTLIGFTALPPPTRSLHLSAFSSVAISGGRSSLTICHRMSKSTES
jgi:Ribonuclease HII